MRLYLLIDYNYRTKFVCTNFLTDARRIILKFYTHLKTLEVEPLLLVGNSKVNIKDLDEQKEDFEKVEIVELSKVFKKLEEEVKRDDVLIVFTDGAQFSGDLTRYAPCLVRFVCLADAEELDATQIQELAEISREACTKSDPPKEHTLFSPVTACSFLEDLLIDKIIAELFPRERFCLKFGNMSCEVYITAALADLRPGNIQCIGFLQAQNMIHIPVDKVLGVFTGEDLESRKLSIPSEDEPGDQKMEIDDGPVRSSKASPVHSSEDGESKDSSEVSQQSTVRQPSVKEEFCKLYNSDLLKTFALSMDKLAMVALCWMEAKKRYIILRPELDDVEGGWVSMHLVPSSLPLHHKLSSLVSEPLKEDEVLDIRNTSPDNSFKPSYALNRPAWFCQDQITLDIQKLLRALKKLPDRSATFYNEINRIRRHCILTADCDILCKLGERLIEESKELSPSAREHAVYAGEALMRKAATSNRDPIPPKP